LLERKLKPNDARRAEASAAENNSEIVGCFWLKWKNYREITGSCLLFQSSVIYIP